MDGWGETYFTNAIFNENIVVDDENLSSEKGKEDAHSHVVNDDSGVRRTNNSRPEA